MGKLMLIVFVFTLTMGGYAFAGESDMAKEVQTKSDEIKAKFDKFEQNGDVQLLYEVEQLCMQLGQHWEQNPNLVRSKVLGFELILLQVCFESRDKAYDLANPPQMWLNVPPPKSVPGLMAGMDPAYVKDPVVRKEYEEAIAENERRIAKHSRESKLLKFIDGGMRHIQRHLNLSKKIGMLQSDAKVIKDTIKNADLMKKINDEILVHFYDENGTPLSK